jgi:hypothetical protein
MAANFIWRAHLALLSVLTAKDVRIEVLDSLEKGVSETFEEAPDSDESTSVKCMHAKCAAGSFGVCVGIARFCDDIGVEPRKLLGLEASCLPVWEFLSDFAEGYVYDEGTAGGVYQDLASEWVAFVDDGAVPGERPRRAA